MERLLSALESAADAGLMPRGSAILLAVSGGADSLALLAGSSELKNRLGWRLAVGHVHHGWRGKEADRDLLFVRDLARRLGLPFASRHRDAREESRRLGLSPESGARYARYAALHEMAIELGCASMATAHQREDRIESYLLARERRLSLVALAGPRARREDGVIRPLLRVSRHEILEFLRRRGLPFRRDASNGDLSLGRNRVRRALALRTEERGPAVLESSRPASRPSPSVATASSVASTTTSRPCSAPDRAPSWPMPGPWPGTPRSSCGWPSKLPPGLSHGPEDRP